MQSNMKYKWAKVQEQVTESTRQAKYRAILHNKRSVVPRYKVVDKNGVTVSTYMTLAEFTAAYGVDCRHYKLEPHTN